MTPPECICKLTAFLHRLKAGVGYTPEDVSIAQASVDDLARSIPCQVPTGIALESWLKTFGNTPPPPPGASQEPRQAKPKGVNLAIEKFLRQCKDILSDIEDMPEAGKDFGASVAEKIEEIMETVDKTQEITERQETAVENMGAGVAKWVH